jgi:hypothetical protein
MWTKLGFGHEPRLPTGDLPCRCGCRYGRQRWRSWGELPAGCECRSVVGDWWLATTNRQVTFEAWCERGHLIGFDFDPDIVGIADGHSELSSPTTMVPRPQVPITFCTPFEGGGSFIDIKPDDLIDAKDPRSRRWRSASSYVAVSRRAEIVSMRHFAIRFGKFAECVRGQETETAAPMNISASDQLKSSNPRLGSCAAHPTPSDHTCPGNIRIKHLPSGQRVLIGPGGCQSLRWPGSSR